jgi:hypothetical protein
MEDSMTKEQITAETARVNALIRARDGKAGYRQNVEAMKARLAELQDMTPDNG